VHNRLKDVVSTKKNEFKEEYLSADTKEIVDFVRKRDYDAILFLPFSHLSSENIMIVGTEGALHEACVLSYHTNTPLLNSLSSRMSIDESVAFNNLFSPEFIDKDLCRTIGYDKKIALIKNNQPLKPNELRMIWSSEKILENEQYKVFDFVLGDWNGADYYNSLLLERDSAIHKKDGWFSKEKNSWFRYESWDDRTASETLDGDGAFEDVKHGIDVIFTLERDGKTENGNYVVSFWFYYEIDRPDITSYVEVVYNDGQEANWESPYSVFESNHIVDGWCFVEMEFELTDAVEKTNIILTGNGSEEPFIVDELLIRKNNGSKLFREVERNGVAYLIYNNHRIKEGSFAD